jgi:pimeloyl-ACP methyl ester carboxylesterase
MWKNGNRPMIEWNLSEKYVFNGHTVRYDICGDGPPVVLVHGTPWSSFNLRHIIKALSENFTVYYYDLLGYGQSDKSPDDVSLGIQNQILNGLLDHWQLKQPAIIGHDFGGATILRTHLLNARDFNKIVLIDPVAVSPWGSQFFQHVKTHEAAFSGVPNYIHEAIVRAYVKTAAFKPIDDNTLDMIVAPWLGDNGKAAFYRQIAQSDSTHTDAVQPFYAQISNPVLILWGHEDVWIPLERGEALHDMIPGSILRVIPNAGHLVIEEEPDQLIEAIRSFL